MRPARRTARYVAALLLALAGAAHGQLLIAANSADNTLGVVNVLRSRTPWKARPPTLLEDADVVLAFGPRGRVAALSRGNGTISIANPHNLRPRLRIPFGRSSQLEDIAISDGCTAYVTRRNATRLLRIDLCSGAARESVDLASFADADGIPDLGAMAVDRGRLFVQVRRYNAEGPFGTAPPAYLAVVDLASETLVDCDPLTPGTQAIQLVGTAPKHRMQVVRDVVPSPPGAASSGQAGRERTRLFVSASGGVFDAGGLEAVDLDRLASDGLVLREADGQTGADLGPFVMTSPEGGFLIFRTDLDLSSHLKRFTLRGGVEPGPEDYVTVGYAVPSLVHDARAGAVFLVDGAVGNVGLHAFDATSGRELSDGPAWPTAGRPTDLVLLGR
ncbi:MAG: hypothetical protein ABI629_11740 [bacterium]